jgi:hypothetical protein
MVEHGKRTIPLPRLLEEARRDAPHIAEHRTPNTEHRTPNAEAESREREKRVSDWQPTTEN